MRSIGIGVFVCLVRMTPLVNAEVIDIVGSTVLNGGGEFADYSGLPSGNNIINWDPSAVNDGVVSLSVGRFGLNGDTSVSPFNKDSYKGPGTEINFGKGLGNISAATGAINGKAFLSIIVDSTGLSGSTLQLNSVSLSLWRNGVYAAQNYQFAYSTDSTWDASDLLGSPTNKTDTSPFTVSTGDLSSLAAPGTQTEIRLYFWGDGTIIQGNTHLYNVTADYSCP